MLATKGSELYLLPILDLGTRWGEWSASRLGRGLPPGKDPQYLLDRRLDDLQKDTSLAKFNDHFFARFLLLRY
jgi:hypothetical protein